MAGRSCSFVGALVALSALLAVGTARASYDFDSGIWLGPAGLLADWSAALTRTSGELERLDACRQDAGACPSGFQGLATLLVRAGTLTRDDQIRLVHRYMNRRPYLSDRATEVVSALDGEVIHLRSRWQSLGEFLARGGDCQGYAIGKYHVLRLLGIPAADLRIVVTHERSTRGHHAMLAVRRGDRSWLLDSDNNIHRTLPIGSRLVYAVNEIGIWDHQFIPGSEPAVLPTESS